MWTNYYIRNNICECCNRSEEEHIWKSSGWWDFTIAHNPDNFNSFKEFKEYIKWKRIFDEYWTEIQTIEFLELLKIKKKTYPFAHRKTMDKYPWYWKYIDWYYFLEWEFS